MDRSVKTKVERTINNLVIARKYLQFYPPENPTVETAFEQLETSIHDVVKDPGLRDSIPETDGPGEFAVTLDRSGFLIDEERLCQTNPAAAKFSEELYRLGVYSLAFSDGVTIDELRRFLDFTCRPPREIEAGGGFEKLIELLDVPHIHTTMSQSLNVVERDSIDSEVDFVDYLRRKQALRGAPDATAGRTDDLPDDGEDISDIAEFFSHAAKDASDERRYLLNTLSDPARLATALNHIAHTSTPQQTYQEELQSVETLRNAFDSITKIISGLSQEKQSQIISSMAQALLAADTQTREKVIEQGMARRIGKEEAVGDVLLNMKDRDVAEALSSHVRLHEGTANTVENFLEEFSSDRSRRLAIRATVVEMLANEDSERIKEVATALESDAEFHPQAPNRDFRPETVEIDQAERKRLREEVQYTETEAAALREAAETDFNVSTEDHAIRVLYELYANESAWPLSEKTESEFIGLATQMLENRRYDSVSELLEMTAEDMSADVRATAADSLKRIMQMLSESEHMDGVIQQLSAMKTRGARYHRLVYILDLLGDRSLSHVFNTLVTEKNRVKRLFLVNLLAEMGERVVTFLGAKVRHPEWYVVRNVLYMLGKIGSDAAFEYIAQTLHHSDMRVRREALSSIAAIRGPRAEDLLIQSLDDDEPVFRRLAAEWLGHIGARRALPIFREWLTDRAKELKQDNEFAIGIVRAVGLLGGPSEIELVKNFAPRRGLFGRAWRSELAGACDEAVARIEQSASGVNVGGLAETKS